ncbi:Uncharacterized membrane protein YfhO [Acetitomaculum ruminis DSM 5522]|uniref:Uncharacterized membrane protein YfhO n=1 Tax=Acetitomaculum ruminis DSM 5522 TaxID=1120918 RepID=A0A1I1A042_9FIRM|nr:YfhO family protein [Acetitomaculum ruminis]SFB29938.1 Uncharacterized membrane protein YfhO [Acetitomaculum ruminis DSM 5522]
MLSVFNAYFTNEKKKINYFCVYTLLFLVMAFFVYISFIFSNRSLVWDEDGMMQHLKALIYYSKYLRGIIKNLIFNHKLIIPDWDFNIGEGSDILTTFHYYVIGDPIALFSVFIPVRYMQYFYSFSSILRLYLAGISFSFLAFGTGRKNRYGIVAGALTYSFCFWAMYNSARHLFFINPLIYFPLVILGIEKIIKDMKPYLFIIFVAVSALSNFYFFYMIVLLAIFYTLVRLAFLYKKDLKKAFLMLIKIGINSLIGVFLAGIIFLPVLNIFLHDSRMTSSTQKFHLFYPLGYYSSLPSVLTTSNISFWLCMGFGIPAIIAIFVLFVKKKENTFLKTLFIICVIFTIFPIFGRLLNGMSYSANRWSWGFALLCSYILTSLWENIFSLEKEEYKKIVFINIIYFLICLFADESRELATYVMTSLIFIALILINIKLQKKKISYKYLAMLLILIVNVINISFWYFSFDGDNYVGQCLENSKIEEENTYNEINLVKDVNKGKSYTRITGRDLRRNANVLKNVSSTQYFWSISNPFLNNYRTLIAALENRFFLYEGYDDRTTPIELSSIDYFLCKSNDDKGIPYGYTLMKKENVKSVLINQAKEDLKAELSVDKLSKEQEEIINKSFEEESYALYKNDYALPLGYSYDTCISKKNYENLDPIQKQQIQLEAVEIEKNNSDIKELSKKKENYSIPYEISCESENIVITKEGFITTADNEKVTLTFKGKANSEICLGFENFDFEAISEYDLYFGDELVDPNNLYNKTNWDLLSKDQQLQMKKDKKFYKYTQGVEISIISSKKVKKTLEYIKPEAMFSSGRHDFVVNLGYNKKPEKKIVIKLPKAGRYTFDDLKVYCVSMDDYENKVSKLKENVLENVQMDVDKITGTIDLKKKKILVMSIPYSSGWSAYIDGKKVDTFVANERHIGIEVYEGFHNVEFRYSLPFKFEGALMTLLGFVGFGLMVIVRKICKNKSINAHNCDNTLTVVES